MRWLRFSSAISAPVSKLIPGRDAVVLIEWWRGTDRHQQEILSRLVVEQTSDRIAKAAGAALATLRDAKAMG
jgi:hypothetical protein